MVYVNENKENNIDDIVENLAEKLSDIMLEEDLEDDNDASNQDVDPGDESNSEAEKDMNENYIEYNASHFLESVLDPAAKEFSDKIVALNTDGCSIVDMIEVLESIKESSLLESTKDLFAKDVVNAYLSNTKTLEESVVLEFTGNPEKNKEFIKYLNLMEKYIKDRCEANAIMFKLGDAIIKDMKAGLSGNKDDSEKLRKAINNCKNDIDDYIAMYNKKVDDVLTNDYSNLQKYDSLRRKFNNKYSKEVIAAKKNIATRIDKLKTDFLDGELRDWMVVNGDKKNHKCDEVFDLYDQYKKIDRDMALRLNREVINPALTAIFNLSTGTVNLINYIIYNLNIEIEGTLKYKIVQKILKDKKGSDSHEEVENKDFTADFSPKNK